MTIESNKQKFIVIVKFAVLILIFLTIQINIYPLTQEQSYFNHHYVILW